MLWALGIKPEFLHQRLPHSKLDIVEADHFTWEDAAADYAALSHQLVGWRPRSLIENTRESLNSQTAERAGCHECVTSL